MKNRLMQGLALLALATGVQAHAQADRTTLPLPAAKFNGVIAENVLDSKASPRQPTQAPQGAPNVLLFMSDDVGFAMTSTFGGPVPTPNFERMAKVGQRYNRFHTVGVCSPTRAALLTGRNHHNAGTGHVSDLAAGFPSYQGFIPRETATVAETLRLNGYSTAMFGKHHNVPPGEDTAAGPFDNWPTGLGFEYFYGIVNADSDQFNPNLYRGTNRVDPAEGQGRMIEKRLADDIINWVHNQKAAAPSKPFLVYWAPGSAHAPHQAPSEYIARMRGQFDQGWDKVREETYRRQLAMGIIPKGTKLTPRPDKLPAWDTLSAAEKAYAARSMEVAAAMLAYQDEQLGRVLDELQRIGQLDQTLVAIIAGDNGGSLDNGPSGTINESGTMSGGYEDPAWRLANTDRLGGTMTYANYPAGWGWAMNTPFQWGKSYVSMLGGVRNGMVLSWSGKVARPGAVCSRFGHIIDITPTILEAAGLPAPTNVHGVPQKPIDGKSLVSSLRDCQPDTPRTQYFEVGGKVSLYHNGWLASNDDERLIWENLPPTGARPQTKWSLYDLSKDFSQNTDISAKNPEQMNEMIALWKKEADRNQVFPLDHRFLGARFGGVERSAPPKHYDFWGKDVSTPAGFASWAGRSFTLNANVVTTKADTSGVVAALGSHFGGWSLFFERGKPVFVYAASTNPTDILRIEASQPLPAGPSKLRLHFATQGYGKSARITLSANDTVLASGEVERTFNTPAGLGETFDIGRDIGVPVTAYSDPTGRFDGEVPHASITFD